MFNIPIYIITLDFRKDRQDRIKSALIARGVNSEFIYSSKLENDNFQALPKATQIEVAIWNSHVKAMRKLNSSESQWALILEDDALIENTSLKFLNSQVHEFISILGEDFGIIQIGWIPNSENKGFRHLPVKVFKAIFGLNRFDLKSKIRFILGFGVRDFRRKTQDLQKRVNKEIVPLLGMRLGTHAYLIKREAAVALIQRFEDRHLINNFKTIDQELLTLTRKRYKNSQIMATRFNLSLVDQSQEDSDNVGKTVH